MFAGSVVGFITAQQLCRWFRGVEGGGVGIKKGGKGKLRGGRKGGGEAVGPALLALGPALASNCNSSSGEKVSSAWLPLTSPEGLSPPALSPAAGLPFNTHTIPLFYNSLPPSSFETRVLKKKKERKNFWQLSAEEPSDSFASVLSKKQLFRGFVSTKWRVGEAEPGGKYVSCGPGLKYHPLPSKQQRCRQPRRLVTSLFFDPPTFL